MDIQSAYSSNDIILTNKEPQTSKQTNVLKERKNQKHQETTRYNMQQLLENKEHLDVEQQQHRPSLSMKERYEKLLMAKKNVVDNEGFHSPRVRVSRTSFLSARRAPLLKEESFRRRSDVMKSALIVVDPLRLSSSPTSSPRKDPSATLLRKSQQHSYDKLKKKLKKVEELQRDIIKSKGKSKGRKNKNYKKYESKRLEYVAALEECEAETEEDTSDPGSVEMEECKKSTDTSIKDIDKKKDQIERAVHEKSLDRQFRRLQEIENLKRIYQRLSLQRKEAEAGAERATAANLALGEDFDDDDSDVNENNKGQEEEKEDEEEEQQVLPTKRHSHIALELTIRELNELQQAHSSYLILERKRWACERALLNSK